MFARPTLVDSGADSTSDMLATNDVLRGGCSYRTLNDNMGVPVRIVYRPPTVFQDWFTNSVMQPRAFTTGDLCRE